jgi:hypothetical protein
MRKTIIRFAAKFRNIWLFSLLIPLIAIILTLGWINHHDFERSVISSELHELLIIAKSASHDIEAGILAIKQEPPYIDRLIQHINDEETFTTFVMNNKHIILSDPVKRHVGKDILEVGKEVLNEQELSKLNAFMERLDSNDSGTATLLFPTKDDLPKKEMKLFAFAHLQGKNGLYSVIVTERLSALTGPLYSNLRDVLVLIGLFFLIFLVFGYIFYRIQKKKFQMEITSRALEIINKELHCEIDDYKSVDKRLRNYRR